MGADEVQLVMLEDEGHISLAELAECSGLSEQDLGQLIDFGVIAPEAQRAELPVFSARWIMVSRIAFRLRCAFELDGAGVAIALTLLERIQDLESELRDARARAPARRM